MDRDNPSNAWSPQARVLTATGRPLGRSGLWRESALTSLAFVISRLPAFLIPVAVARLLGATAATDAFFVAFAIMSFVLAIFTGVTESVAVPFLVEQLNLGRGRAFLRQITVLVMFGTVIALGGGIGFSMWLAARGFGILQIESFRFSILALSPFAIFGIVASVYAGALYASRGYRIAISTAGIQSIVTLSLIYFLVPAYGLRGLIMAYVSGAGAQAAVLYLVAHRRYGITSPFLLADFKVTADGWGFVRGAAWQLAASAVLAAALLIDRPMALLLPAGSVSILSYAERVWQVPVSALMSGLLVVSLAEWSRSFHESRDLATLSRDSFRTALTVSALALPVTVGLILLRRPLASALFGAGSLPAEWMPVLANTLAAYLGGVPLYVGGLVYTKALLVLKGSHLLFKVTVAMCVVKVLLNYLLMQRWGVAGIAAATSVMFAFSSVYLAIILHRMAAASHAWPRAVHEI